MTPEQLSKAHAGESVDLSENPNHLRFSDDPSLADEVIGRFLSYRTNEVRSIKEHLLTDFPTFDLMSLVYDPYKEFDFRAEGMALYYIKRLTSIYKNEWTPDSGVYDLDQWDASLKYFFQRVAKNPEHQFLIPVDFHY